MKHRKIATCLCGAGESEVQLAWHAVWNKDVFEKIWHVECLRCGRRTGDTVIPRFAIEEWKEMVGRESR